MITTNLPSTSMNSVKEPKPIHALFLVLTKNSSDTFRVSILKKGVIYDLSSLSSAVFKAKYHFWSPSALISKSLGAGIEIVAPDTAGIIDITILKTDLAAAPPFFKEFVWELQLDSGAEDEPFSIFGKGTISPSITDHV